ncbi:Oxygen sensor histidine kinase NreB [Variovorax sp. SRS16]|uniref:histidine kinase n=1 Tax=Variovorax sp. SRS16 TaxID=282217 RepID=UPI001317D412|nr:histidine kinase [Variovorax sp. SRS16]VTU26838.1 Oxygen sensor histidine kinase NreB [Variovorax sp. SRS16]
MIASMHAAHRGAGPSWRVDLAWVLVLSAATFALSSVFELHERLAVAFARHEAWQIDELPTAFVALSLGLVWYAWRRRRETARWLARNRELAQQLIAVQESERLALARELHDELAQHCTAIRIEATYIQRSRAPDQIGEAARRVSSSAELLQDGVRRLLHKLRPAELDELGLIAALESLCTDWSMRSGTACIFRHRGALCGLGEAVDTAVYRVTQEALANVIRHAEATRVQVELASTPAGLALCIEDNGRGVAPAASTRGFGLRGAAERAAAPGGAFDAFSAPGSGMCVRMQLPAGHALPRKVTA